MNAVPLAPADPRTRTRAAARGTDQLARVRELEALAAALPLLIARDDERPRTWSLPSFTARVAAIRASLAASGAAATLAAHLGPGDPDGPVEGGPFGMAARRLARDPDAVGLAIRWLELEAETRLPSWPELLRRRSLVPGPGDAMSDAGLWFG